MIQLGKLREQRPYILLAAAMLALGGCGLLPKGHPSLDVSAKDRGIASWYGEDFHGKLAADGRPFDMYALTGAHRSLPLGSVVRVTNAQNGRSSFIRITDRGPYVRGRMLDLSYAAAVRLGMAEHGLSPVLVEVVGNHRFVELAGTMTEVPQDISRDTGRTSEMLAGRNSSSDSPQSTRHPEDLWGLRRLRRVADVLAADHHVDRLVATLMVA